MSTLSVRRADQARTIYDPAMARSVSKAAAALASAAVVTGLLSLSPAPAQALDRASTQTERVCVTNSTNGEITHRYVLVKRAGDEVRGWTRMPRRDYPRMWSKLCGPNGTLV